MLNAIELGNDKFMMLPFSEVRIQSYSVEGMQSG